MNVLPHLDSLRFSKRFEFSVTTAVGPNLALSLSASCVEVVD